MSTSLHRFQSDVLPFCEFSGEIRATDITYECTHFLLMFSHLDGFCEDCCNFRIDCGLYNPVSQPSKTNRNRRFLFFGFREIMRNAHIEQNMNAQYLEESSLLRTVLKKSGILKVPFASVTQTCKPEN